MAFAAKNKNNRWLEYTLYVVLVGLVLLYLLFPAQEVEDLVDNSVSRVNPELGFKAVKISPWLPPGLRINGGRIFLGNAAGPTVFAVDTIYIRPQFLKLLSGKYNVKLTGKAYKGDIKGSLRLGDEDGNTFESEWFFEALDISAFDLLAKELQHKLTGMFSGNVVFARDSAGEAGNGRADLKLTDGKLLFENPVFGIDSVDLQNIVLELELQNHKVTIIKGELKGPELNAALAGSIQLQPDVKKSQLNLKGTLEPLPEFYRKHPEIRELLKSMKKRVKRGQYFFAITGTLSQPRFRML